MLLASISHAFVVNHRQQRQRFSTTTPSSPSSQLFQSPAPLSWQSHISTHPEAMRGLQKVLEQVTGRRELSSSAKDDVNNKDLAFLFVGQAHAAEFEQIVQEAAKHFDKSTTNLISLIGGGVIGEKVELDQPEQPGIALLTGKLPPGARVDIDTYNKQRSDFENSLFKDKDPEDGDSESYSYLLLADPWSSVQSLMNSLAAEDTSVVAGGISCPSSASPSLAINDNILPQGSTIAVRFSGSIGLQSLVAQGCRPVGPAYSITEGQGNVITKLDGKPALEVLQEMANALSKDEQKQVSTGLLCGVASDAQEDYLSRQIMAFVPSVKGIAIGSEVKQGDSFCFQVRDKTTAEQDMQLMVQRAKTARLFDGGKGTPMAAIQISCVARGRGLFEAPNVDLNQLQDFLGQAPVGGFFANGEIGPVGISGFSTTNSESYLHGFTTVAAVLCDFSEDDDTKGSAEDVSSNSNAPADELDAWG